MTARLGLVALGILAALGLAEGVLRVAAALDPRVRVLATGRATRPAVAYATLEQFIAAQAAHITPHQPWYNYWSNAFGFHDEEFVEPKPAGRIRILAVGDSFTFAPVPYPQGVMTLTEAALRAACGGRDLDLLNMGLMGAGPPEYRILAELGVPRFTPDLVLVNVFLGNDPPDLHRYVHDRSPLERALRRSHAWTFAKNLLRARGGLREARLPGAGGRGPAGSAGRARGRAGGGSPRAGPGRPGPGGAAPLGVGLPAGARLGPRPLLPAGETSRPCRAAWQPFLADLDAVQRRRDAGGEPDWPWRSCRRSSRWTPPSAPRRWRG